MVTFPTRPHRGPPPTNLPFRPGAPLRLRAGGSLIKQEHFTGCVTRSPDGSRAQCLSAAEGRSAAAFPALTVRWRCVTPASRAKRCPAGAPRAAAGVPGVPRNRVRRTAPGASHGAKTERDSPTGVGERLTLLPTGVRRSLSRNRSSRCRHGTCWRGLARARTSAVPRVESHALSVLAHGGNAPKRGEWPNRGEMPPKAERTPVLRPGLQDWRAQQRGLSGGLQSGRGALMAPEPQSVPESASPSARPGPAPALARPRSPLGLR